MASWANLADGVLVAAMQTFGVTVNYAAQRELDFDMQAVFDAAHEFVASEGDAQFTTTAPSLGVRLASFPPGIDPKQDDVVTVYDPAGIADQCFRVVDAQPDGQGGSMLRLHRAA